MLNLLPPEIKRQRRLKSLLYSTTLLYIIIVVLLGLGAAALLTWKTVLESTINERQARIDQLVTERQAKNKVIAQAAFVEDRVKNAAQFRETRHWEEILNEIAASTPTDTNLTTIAVTTTADKPDQLTLSISGGTTDRRSIVLFRDKLENAEHISSTTIQSLSESVTDGVKQFVFTLSAMYSDVPAKGTP